MKIMVAYDGSDAGKEALKVARYYAKKLMATVVVVTSFYKGIQDNQEAIQEAESGLEYAKSLFKKDQIICNTNLLIRGLSPGEDLITFAEEEGVDQIVIGIRKRSKVGKLLMGSTAQYVILNARCPVVSISKTQKNLD